MRTEVGGCAQCAHTVSSASGKPGRGTVVGGVLTQSDWGGSSLTHLAITYRTVKYDQRTGERLYYYDLKSFSHMLSAKRGRSVTGAAASQLAGARAVHPP